MDITTKTKRKALRVRNEPYWMKQSKGAYLGFRRGPDTWNARYRVGDRQHYHALHGAVEYDDAKRMAEAWFRQMGAGTTRKGTVREALEAYLAWLRDQGRGDTADTEEKRYKLIVWKDRLAKMSLHDLSREDFRQWRNRLRKERQPRSVNRHVRGVVGGLNRAVKEGFAGSPEAWNLDPLADDTEDTGETAVFLSPEQRKAIIAACEPSAALFLRGLEITGARPKELAAAKVGDLDGDMLRLAHRKGRPAKLRVRSVILGDAKFFKAQAKNKLPAAPLFTDPFGNPWTRHSWAREVRAGIAASKLKIPPAASAYSFRHSRISELLQTYAVDPLTVAAQTGTSVKMLEQTYYQFIPSEMRAKLQATRESS